ncbi:MAG: hypothetical protein ACRD1W_02670 [Vicinamibacterales bacterium]
MAVALGAVGDGVTVQAHSDTTIAASDQCNSFTKVSDDNARLGLNKGLN